VSTSIGPSAIDSSLYIADLRPRKRDSVLHELVACAHRAGVVREPSLLLEVLALRERLGSTSIGKGVAAPNARSITVVDPHLLLARSRRGIDWRAPDGLPVQLVLLVLSPAESSVESHHEFLSRAVASVRLHRNRQKLLDARGFDDVGEVLREVTP
jgi:PTS system nitrogen regulatory IIA component